MTDRNGFQNSPSPLGSAASPGVVPQSPADSVSHGDQSSDTPLTKVQSAPVTASNFPPPKTDKPRPHVCGTCGRSFARLEHLKRHERSHTKEKPFECPECTRCFARRDLLLRHQQKLHLTTAPSSRSAKARRESTTSTGVNSSAKVRKSSTNGSSNGTNPGNMRPRANTISHVDGATLDMLAGVNRSSADYDMGMDQTSDGSGGLVIPMNEGHQNGHQGLTRIHTQGLSYDRDESLRTAPPVPGMNPTFDFDQANAAGSTVNPAQLHLETSLDSTSSNFSRYGSALIEDEENLDWLRGFTTQMNFNGANDQVLGASSPSVMSHGSTGAMGEFIPDGTGVMAPQNGLMWPAQQLQSQGSSAGQFTMDANVSMPQDMAMQIGQMTSPQMNGNVSAENFYTTPPAMGAMAPHRAMNGFSQQVPGSMNFSSDGNSISSASGNGSARHSSITSISTDSITETTRQALIHSLSHTSVFGRNNRKYSQPAVSSPLSPRDQAKQLIPALPSTADLQRYVNAYIQFFHPHFPFLHIPTLSFDTPAYNNNVRPASSSGSTFGQGGVVGGGGCLVLAMAAIGALYEYERVISKDLFDSAKKMIQIYLEARRKSDLNELTSRTGFEDQDSQNTPLWLVQAMLLNVIYGHNCGDKISGEIASTHCSALVSLARAAALHLPLSEESITPQAFYNGHSMSSVQDIQMSNDGAFQGNWTINMQNQSDHAQWLRWIVIEERKRTLFAIFHMSSLLVSAYNHAPALMNSEIHLDLPCEEDLWCAENASAWAAKGGAHGAQQGALPFSSALATLLTASHDTHDHHQSLSHEQPFGSGIPITDLPPSNMRPSTFGCLVLINALHNYIWETRQRHSGRLWTTQETESMHAHIEPALRAWQAAWAANPTHSLERPNPFGLGPLSADSIPLLDLAYVRLFVNLGTSKEAFWQRDFTAMSEELARGTEFVQHADHSEGSTDMSHGTSHGASDSRNSPMSNGASDMDFKIENQEELTVPPPQAIAVQSRSSKRERHLRKAAFYAADSLSMSDKLGVTFADFTSRELPVQSALCTFDCAQVLAEWVATVQERVGRYIGVLGRDSIEYSQVPAIMLLEDEDCKLIDKVSDILAKAEAKMNYEIQSVGASAAMTTLQRLPSVSQNGYGSKILLVTAHMLERAAVWPVTNTMAHGLEIQAQHMQGRAENSVLPPPS